MLVREINPLRPYDTLMWGYLTQQVVCAGTTHNVLVYIPDGVRPSTSGVIILGPNGLSAQEILEKSGWKSLADEVYGDNVFEKCGINRDGAGEVGKPRYFNGKRHF